MNKTVYSASEAAKLAGVSTTAMVKRISKGTISATQEQGGKRQWYIDASELARVYPHVRFDPQQNDDSLTTVDETKTAILEVQLEAEKQRSKLLEDVVDDLRQRLDSEAIERRRLTMILTDQRKVEVQPEPEQRKPLHVWVPQEEKTPEPPKKKWWQL